MDGSKTGFVWSPAKRCFTRGSGSETLLEPRVSHSLERFRGGGATFSWLRPAPPHFFPTIPPVIAAAEIERGGGRRCRQRPAASGAERCARPGRGGGGRSARPRRCGAGRRPLERSTRPEWGGGGRGRSARPGRGGRRPPEGRSPWGGGRPAGSRELAAPVEGAHGTRGNARRRGGGRPAAPGRREAGGGGGNGPGAGVVNEWIRRRGGEKRKEVRKKKMRGENEKEKRKNR